jgi:hypothetical protein
VKEMRIDFGPALRQGLRGEDVLDLGRADPERERREGAVREVWLSPQTIVIPGWVNPSSGPITCTIPSRPLPVAYSGTPNSSQLPRNASSCARASGSTTGPSTVGTLWSMVASDRSGRRTGLPAARSPSNACGEVTSWIRWRSTYRSAGSSGGSRTTCVSQTRSNSVFGKSGVHLSFAPRTVGDGRPVPLGALDRQRMHAAAVVARVQARMSGAGGSDGSIGIVWCEYTCWPPFSMQVLRRVI